MSAGMKCVVCESDLVFSWSDTHGVGCCARCGMPYTIFHYEDNKRVDKPPLAALNDEGIVLAKRYWAQEHARVFPACYDMGFFSGRDRSYSGASKMEYENFCEWYEQQPETVAAKALASTDANLFEVPA